MVADRLANAALYRSLSPKIAQAFDFIARTDLAALPDGTHPIDGEDMFLIVARYSTKPFEASRWEAHRRYIDIQCVVTGTERVGVANIADFVQDPYEEARDVIWMDGDGDLLTFREGTFMIFWPQDAHKPGVMLEAPEPVVKAVVKIAV